ncbi:hypothetical protein [Nocardia cyriacigeorgica]|uniref:hypothetical protein n=1 Tax=Nocardia cyriacigeorgica TaxID=135487 RepID=UPI0018937AC9|nr:hypothetical protein [Nocardia cyriacigeorgica]MBF6440221.1 hypothetical protein [Nocardia cyriacigeorgica]
MKTRTTALAAAALIGTLGVTAGAADATPQDEAIGYTATHLGDRTEITIDAGTFVVENGKLLVRAPGGTTVGGTELAFRVDDFVFPIAATISGHTATLTPLFQREHASYRPVALPFENQAPWRTEYEREQAAWARLTSTISVGAAVGTLVGSLGGAAVGCVLGGIAGATVAAAAIVGLFGAFLPAAAIGCIGGIMAVGALGAVAGQLLVTAPVVVAAAVQYFTTINQPAPTPAPAPAK